MHKALQEWIKKNFCRAILNKKIKLIDYENIRAANGSRYLGFGRFAGIVGCYNTLNLFLLQNNFQPLARAFKINNYERLIKNLSEVRFPNFKMLITGDGRVKSRCSRNFKIYKYKKITLKIF